MGKLKVIKSGPMATIQDRGRFGYRKYGIPQSGAMDLLSMHAANRLVGNEEDSPVIEFALMGMTLEVLEATSIGVVGASIRLNGELIDRPSIHLAIGDQIELSPPDQVYAYLAIGGKLNARNDFGSYSTYLMGGFGGMDGRALKAGDVIVTTGEYSLQPSEERIALRTQEKLKTIRFTRGPEWNALTEPLHQKEFTIDPSSNRMGIRLSGTSLKTSISEIASSAVVPGTIQLPSGGQPIILMNDCQTTGGYPRIGTVVTEDLLKLAQTKPGSSIVLYEVSE